LRFAAASAGFSQSNCFHSNKACRECQELAWFVGTSAIERLLHRLAIASERAGGRAREREPVDDEDRGMLARGALQ